MSISTEDTLSLNSISLDIESVVVVVVVECICWRFAGAFALALASAFAVFLLDFLAFAARIAAFAALRLSLISRLFSSSWSIRLW